MPQTEIYFHEEEFLFLLSFPSFSLTPSNLDLHFLPVLGALDLSPEFMSLVQAAFICFDAILCPSFVSNSGSGGEEPSC